MMQIFPESRRRKMLTIAAALLSISALTLMNYTLWTRPLEASTVTKQPETPFTIVAIPDTQYYAESFPDIFNAQMQWIADNAASRNIIFATHLGDIVNLPDDEKQWQVADMAMARLDHKVRYGIAPGNHDFLYKGEDPLYRKYFPHERIASSGLPSSIPISEAVNSSRYGSYGTKNSYQLFSAGSIDFIAFNLEFCPTDATLEWVDRVLANYKERTAIIATHSFINSLGQRATDASCIEYGAEGTNAGEGIWEKLVVKGGHNNILLTLNGHDIWTDDGAARRTDYVNGRPIHQLLSDYQMFENGGDGYLRLMTFYPSDRKIDVRTYSTTKDTYRTDPDNQFTLNY